MVDFEAEESSWAKPMSFFFLGFQKQTKNGKTGGFELRIRIIRVVVNFPSTLFDLRSIFPDVG